MPDMKICLLEYGRAIQIQVYLTYKIMSTSILLTNCFLLLASPTFEEDQDVWSVDNMIISGRKGNCNAYIVNDGFNTTTTTWLHDTHTERNYFCGSSDESMIVGPTLGEHSITTKDLCISENFVIQFNVSTGT